VRIGISGRAVQLATGTAAVAGAILLAAQRAWPFDASRPKLPARPSLWQLLLSDHVTLGFVRLAFVMVAVFIVASVPALVVGGRWLQGLGAAGFIADDANDPRPRGSDEAAGQGGGIDQAAGEQLLSDDSASTISGMGLTAEDREQIWAELTSWKSAQPRPISGSRSAKRRSPA
jgi:hypothetical protein